MDKLKFYKDPWRQLAAAIILQAVKDWRRKTKAEKKKQIKRELSIFFNSNWFEDLSAMVEMNPENIRKKLGIYKK